MNVLVIGGNGMLGPWVTRSLARRHRVLVTDVQPTTELDVEYRSLDVNNENDVFAATAGMDAIINLAVIRSDRRAAFCVNTLGCYNIVRAAVSGGIRRVVNTGPRSAIVGRSYTDFDFGLSADVPAHPGTQVYGLSKSIGLEIMRCYARKHDVYVQNLLFSQLYVPETMTLPYGQVHLGRDLLTPFGVAWPDAGEAVRLAVEVDLSRLDSRFESYLVCVTVPHGQFDNSKMTRVLGWSPRYHLEAGYTRRRTIA